MAGERPDFPPPAPPPSEPAAPSRDRAGSTMALLRNRNFRLFFLSSFGASLGDWAGLFALQALVYSLASGSQVGLFALGGVIMARILPSLLIGPVAGVLADRYDRKRLLVTSHLVRGVLFVGIAISTDITALLALTFIVESLSMLFVAAKDATLPTIIEPHQRTEANQLNLLVTYGPLPLGAVLFAAVAGLGTLLGGPAVDGTRFTLAVNAATFLVAAILMSRLRLPRRQRPLEQAEQPGFLDDLRAGLEFISTRPLVRALILGVVGIFFGAGVVVTLGPAFVEDELGRPARDWSLLVTSVGVGLVAGIALVRLLRRLPREKVFPWGLAATAATAAAIATVETFAVTLALGFVLGVAGGVSFVLGYTVLQDWTPDALRGKTFAAFYTANRVALFIALGVAPVFAGTLNVLYVSNLAGQNVLISGVRLSIFLGALIGMTSAAVAGRNMYRALRDERLQERTGVRLHGPERGTPAKRGLFIAFEGVEGSGKSTQVQRLAERLETEGCDVLVTREPGGSPVAEQVRVVLLRPDADIEPRTEALLYAAARAEHVEKVVRPALDAGRIVVCDRFLDSSLVYQGYARDLGLDDIAEINAWAAGRVVPHAVVLLDLDPQVGLRRVAQRTAGAPDRIEQEDEAFHRRVAEGYRELAKRYPGRFVVVDAAGDPDEVAARVRHALQPWLPAPADPQAPAPVAEAQRAGERS